MPFANGYNGDVVTLNHVIKTVKEKRVLVPGIITNPNLSVTAKGEIAYFFTQAKTSVKKVKLGDKFVWEPSGAIRHYIPMEDALRIQKSYSHAEVDTLSTDIVTADTLSETIEQMNLWNREGLGELEAAAEVKTLDGATAWEQFVNAIAEFKMDNADNGFAPTGVLMSPKFAAQIKLDQRFLIGVDRDSVARTGYLGRIDGVDTIETLDLKEGFIIVNSTGVAAPINVHFINLQDGAAAGQPVGKILSGDLGYGFKVVTRVEDTNLGTGYFVSKYTA